MSSELVSFKNTHHSLAAPEVPFSAEASEAGTHHAFIQTIGPLRGIHDAL